MKNRNQRDTERRQYIKEKTLENLKLVENDPESLFAEPNKIHKEKI